MCFPIIGKANVQVMCIKPKEHGGILVLKIILKMLLANLDEDYLLIVIIIE